MISWTKWWIENIFLYQKGVALQATDTTGLYCLSYSNYAQPNKISLSESNKNTRKVLECLIKHNIK